MIDAETRTLQPMTFEAIPTPAPVLTLVKAQTGEQYHYDAQLVEQAIQLGDMKQMSPDQRVQLYRAVCLSAGLNPLTQPFTWLERQDKTWWLYANSTCAQQLARIHRVSYKDLNRVHETLLGEPFYRVELTAYTPDGRELPSQGILSLTKKKRVQNGAWPLKQGQQRADPRMVDALDEDGEPILIPLRGQALADAMMKCDTKAMRRAVMALVGLGWIGTEFEGTPVAVGIQTGELREAPAPVALLSDPREAAKGVAGHSADLCGDPVTVHPEAEPAGAERSTRTALVDEIELAILGYGGELEGYWAKQTRRFAGQDPRAIASLGALNGLLLECQAVATRLAEERQQRQGPQALQSDEPGEDIPF